MFNNPYTDQILSLELQPHGHRPDLYLGEKLTRPHFHIFNTTLTSCSYEELLDTFWTKTMCKFWDQICAIVTNYITGNLNHIILISISLCFSVIPGERSLNFGAVNSGFSGLSESSQDFEWSSPLSLQG